jgi:hypothetical protein
MPDKLISCRVNFVTLTNREFVGAAVDVSVRGKSREISINQRIYLPVKNPIWFPTCAGVLQCGEWAVTFL